MTLTPAQKNTSPYVFSFCSFRFLCFSRVVRGVAGAKGDCSEVCHADSPTSNPVFGLRQEYRTGPEGVSGLHVSHFLRDNKLSLCGWVSANQRSPVRHDAVWGLVRFLCQLLADRYATINLPLSAVHMFRVRWSFESHLGSHLVKPSQRHHSDLKAESSKISGVFVGKQTGARWRGRKNINFPIKASPVAAGSLVSMLEWLLS